VQPERQSPAFPFAQESGQVSLWHQHRRLPEVAALGDLHFADAVDYQFAGLTLQDTPLVSARMSTANLYAAHLPGGKAGDD
jgi:hypothetical protein